MHPFRKVNTVWRTAISDWNIAALRFTEAWIWSVCSGCWGWLLHFQLCSAAYPKRCSATTAACLFLWLHLSHQPSANWSPGSKLRDAKFTKNWSVFVWCNKFNMIILENLWHLPRQQLWEQLGLDLKLLLRLRLLVPLRHFARPDPRPSVWISFWCFRTQSKFDQD